MGNSLKLLQARLIVNKQRDIKRFSPLKKIKLELYPAFFMYI